MSNSIYMPNVDADDETQQKCFAMAREISNKDRAVAIVTPGRLIMPIETPPPGTIPPEKLKAIRQIVPHKKQQYISVIAFNNLVLEGALTVQEANVLIPFLGYLIGMAYVGHNVLVFEGHPSAMRFGCREADLVILDKEMASHLQPDSVSVACRAMRNPHIMVFGRDGSIETVDTERYMRNPEQKEKRKWWWFN